MEKVRIRVYEGGVYQRVQDRFSAPELVAIQYEVDTLLELPTWNTYTYYYTTEFVLLEENEDPYVLCRDLYGEHRTFPGCFTTKFLDRAFPIQPQQLGMSPWLQPIVVRFESA